MTIKALLFDNDGVLVDTEILFLEATVQTLAPLGIHVDEDVYREISLRRGQSVIDLARDVGASSEEVEALRAQRNVRYAELIDAGVRTIGGVVEALESLHGRFPMGIVTSSYRDHFEQIHARSGLMRFFDFVLAAGDYGRHKPHPDSYLAGAGRIGHPPEHCLAIEDSERGLRAALAAGMRCVVVPNALTAGADFSGATRVIERLDELHGVLEELA